MADGTGQTSRGCDITAVPAPRLHRVGGPCEGNTNPVKGHRSAADGTCGPLKRPALAIQVAAGALTPAVAMSIATGLPVAYLARIAGGGR